MITPRDLQIAWITYLKSVPAIISPVPIIEVREDSWKGDVFTYPNIRIQVVNVVPDINPQCNRGVGITVIKVFSEQKSSNEGSAVAGAIANLLHGKNFTSSGVKFSGVIVEWVTGPMPTDETMLTWKSEIRIRTLMN
jgi:hypothetical protein